MISSRVLESRFDQCDDSCGWVAAVVAALAYGTFGVPIKETVSVDVHPLILQSYKTVTMFVMSWLVVFMGESICWTPWGLLSGLLWVLGGTGGIYAVREAGMAIAVGTWSSVMILVNFLVGIVFFREPVASFWSTSGAFLCLGIGLVGMSVYSAKATAPAETIDALMDHDEEVDQHHDNNEQQIPDCASVSDRSTGSDKMQITSRFHAGSRDHEEEVIGYSPLEEPRDDWENSSALWRDRDRKTRIFLFFNRIGLTKRELGIMGAVMNGVLTGSSLVPVHYAKRQGLGGAAYMISFATGALMANCTVWAVFFAGKMALAPTNTSLRLNFRHTYEAMPLIYFRQLWIPAFSGGILLAIAMFGSIMSVTYLGQGVGNSIIQSKILISGLWGIFWYREITGRITIAKWFSSAAITICGILWLSLERIHAKTPAEGHMH